jgi:hypothetical protein
VTCLVSAAEAARDTGPLHDKADLEAARLYLTERLHEGKTVSGCTLRDLIDDDLNGHRAGFATIEITNLMLADSDEVAALRDTYVEGVIERFLESREHVVAETAAELAAEVPGV